MTIKINSLLYQKDNLNKILNLNQFQSFTIMYIKPKYFFY